MSAPSSDLVADVSVAFEGVGLLADGRILIDQATGIVRSGRLTAVVSACGSRGDLLLLQVLAGLKHPNSGTVVANCVPVSSTTYAQNAAFITTSMQEPPTSELVSVLENMHFSLRMRATLSADEASARIARVLGQLQLHDVADVAVAQLSPADRVKLCIATELALQPDFVFLDFSHHALATPAICDILQVLADIAVSERIVVAVAMVQPRWLFLEFCEDVLIVEHSRLYYCGTREALLPLLYEADAQRPNSFNGHENVPLLGAPPRPTSSSSSPTPAAAASSRNAESHLNSLYILCASTRQADLLEPPGFTAARSRATTDVATHLRNTAQGRIPMYEPRSGVSGNEPFVIVKLLVMALYAVSAERMRLPVLVFRLLVAIAAFMLLARMYAFILDNNNPVDESEKIQNATGVLFFAVSVAFLHNVLHIEPFRAQLAKFEQHRAQGYYGAVFFIGWTVLSNLVVRAVLAVLFTLCVSLVDPVLGFNDLQHLVVVLSVLSFCALSLAWAVLAVFPAAKQLPVAMFVATYSVSALFGGLFINLLSLPSQLASISRASLIRLGYEAVIIGQFSGKPLGCNATTTPRTTALPAPSPLTTRFTSQPPTSTGPAVTEPRPPLMMNGGLLMRDGDLGAVYASSCTTGDAYILSAGFAPDHKWENLVDVTYIFLAFFAIFCFGMWLRRSSR
jgi:ABC-2 type transport system ATP-binding protein